MVLDIMPNPDRGKTAEGDTKQGRCTSDNFHHIHTQRFVVLVDDSDEGPMGVEADTFLSMNYDVIKPGLEYIKLTCKEKPGDKGWSIAFDNTMVAYLMNDEGKTIRKICL